MIFGVQNGYMKELEIQGVGYKAQMQGKILVLSLGFSHDIKYEIPEGIKVEVAGTTDVKVSGHEKALVGLVAARIRAFAPAEPYKGKGVRYKGEQVRRKEGKAVA
jgi:large subunit ribosomal protein L6